MHKSGTVLFTTKDKFTALNRAQHGWRVEEMSSREQFEAFLVSEYEWGNDALNASNFHGDDATGYYTGGDFIYDGQSCSEGLFWAWRGWQAAELAAEKKLTGAGKRIAELESREVKLPELKMLSDYLAEVTMREREDILVGVRLEFFRALKEAGVNVQVHTAVIQVIEGVAN